jgi:uncharacterized coiled-coil protein SlyX
MLSRIEKLENEVEIQEALINALNLKVQLLEEFVTVELAKITEKLEKRL